MTIKEQIEAKINALKSEFYEETGISLIVIPEYILPRISIYDVSKECCEYLNLNIDYLDTNKKQAVKAKEYITAACLRMGHEESLIHKGLNLDRTSLYTVKTRFDKKLRDENNIYKYDFYKFLEHLYKKVSKTYYFSNGNWEKRYIFLDMMFIEKKSEVPRNQSVKYQGTYAAMKYIQDMKRVRSAVVIDYLISNSFYKDRKTAANTISWLKKTKRIKKQGQLCISI